MNYEKKYKEALERAREWYNNSNSSSIGKSYLYAVFPELKESKDERIRKVLIELSKEVAQEQFLTNRGTNLQNVIAWLEKQEGCEYIKKDWLEHIKQSWYKEGFIEGKYNGGTSKEWTINDAATLKELIDFLENGTAKLQHDLTRYANWLKIQFTPIEKQGEKKCIDDLTQQEAMDIAVAKCFEQGGQKPVDKVEPKFNQGDWVIDKQGIVHQIANVIENVTNHTYGYDIVGGGYFNDNTEGVKLWTIQDAKDGDVLASNRSIFIFSQEYIAGKPEAHCGIMNGLFLVKPEGCWTNEECYPATKEQRDTLERAMTNAGYRWNKEELKLEKI